MRSDGSDDLGAATTQLGTVEPPAGELPAGAEVGRYRIRARVGEGGMGVVYAAEHRQTCQPVAIKVLRRDLGGGQGPLRFQREVDVLAELGHARIVRYLDHGVTADGVVYLVMEWLSGEDLAQRLERGALSVKDSCAVVRGAAEALGHAHERGFVHRDIKPSNLFLVGREAGAVRLLDFGIARTAHSDSAVTHTGMMIGTPGYMAPEQARADDTLDARADLFSLGTVLYECLAGRPLFIADSPIAVLAKVLLEPSPP
jgi:serine/threonine protein kinase